MKKGQSEARAAVAATAVAAEPSEMAIEHVDQLIYPCSYAVIRITYSP